MANDILVNFDIFAFGQSVINMIDSVRVTKADVQTSSQNNIGESAAFESRINAFFRMLGFQKYFLYGEENIMEEYVSGNERIQRIKNRQSVLTFENLSQNEDERLIQALNSIRFPRNPKPAKRDILPLVWQGDLIITNNKKIAEPFEREGPEAKLPKPLLEAIIDLRVNKASIFSEEVKSFLVSKFGSLTEEQENVSNDFSGSSLSFVILKNFDLIAQKIAELNLKLIQEYSDILDEITFAPLPTVVGSLLKHNNDHSFGLGSFSKKNTRIEKLQAYRDILDTVVALTIDQTSNTGRSVRSNVEKINLVRDNMFMGPLMSIARANIEWLENEIKKVNNEIKKFEVKMEKIRVGMDLLYGTTLGISLVDIFCLLWALMELEEESLLGLLTDDQFENYKAFDTSEDLTKGALVDSYYMLEELFITKIEIIREKIINTYKRTSIRGRKP